MKPFRDIEIMPEIVELKSIIYNDLIANTPKRTGILDYWIKVNYIAERTGLKIDYNFIIAITSLKEEKKILIEEDVDYGLIIKIR